MKVNGRASTGAPYPQSRRQFTTTVDGPTRALYIRVNVRRSFRQQLLKTCGFLARGVPFWRLSFFVQTEQHNPLSLPGEALSEPARMIGSMVSKKSVTLGRGCSTSSDWKIYPRAKVRLELSSGRVSTPSGVPRGLTLLENTSGIFKDMIGVFLSRILEKCHNRLEVFRAHHLRSG